LTLGIESAHNSAGRDSPDGPAAGGLAANQPTGWFAIPMSAMLKQPITQKKARNSSNRWLQLNLHRFGACPLG
jgi:hypothetical protein